MGIRDLLGPIKQSRGTGGNGKLHRLASNQVRRGRGSRRRERRPAAWVAVAAAFVGVLVLGAIDTARADEELDYGLQQTRLARIELTGNATFGDRELKDVLRLRDRDWTRPLAAPSYRPDLVETQLRLLRNWYRQRGFHAVQAALDSVVAAPEDGDILYISVREGPRTMIERVVLLGGDPVLEHELRGLLTRVEGTPAPAEISGLGEDIYRMRRLFWDRAHLRARIDASLQMADADSVLAAGGSSADRLSATVIYRLRPGPVYRVRDVKVSGQVATRENLITREIRLAPGDLFTWEAVDLTREHLLQTALFRDASITAANWDTTGHTADVVVRVTERKPAFYEVGVGFGSRERIRAQAAWGHNNLWGTGRRLTARLRGYWNVEEIIEQRRDFVDGDLNYRADLLYSNPHFIGSAYPLDFNLFAKRETRGESALIQSSTGFIVGTARRDHLNWVNRLDFRFKVVDPDVHPLAPPDLQEEFAAANVTATQTRSVLHSLFHEARDDVFNPSQGRYFTSQVEIAGGLLGGDNSFLKWSGSYQHYHTLLGGVLATRVRLGAVRPYGDSRQRGSAGVPYDDRFFAGGAYSVRGYRDNSLGPQILEAEDQTVIGWGSDVPLPDNPAAGGNYQLITNIEWRFPIPVLRRWNFSSVAFFDGGNVWEDLDDIQLQGFRLRSYPGEPTDDTSTKIWDYRYSIGTGLRLDTPFGPFRLDVGFPLKRARYQNLDKTLEDEKWRTHFSLGHVF
jgi:outer membrane protein insertion porin family